MKLIDVMTSPWAIIPSKLFEIRDIYATHLRGEKIDIRGLEARLGEPLQRKEQGYAVENGVAIIPMDGVIAKKMNLFTQVSGGASTQLIERDIKQAISDPNVKSIIIAIDSPGGTVDGTAELADVVRQAAQIKPIVSWVDGMMASAAYWIGSAADAIYVSGPTTNVGSIGVVATHVDVSRAEEAEGVKTTEIYAGKYKRINSSYQPLSDAGRAYMQDHVDYLYSVFVDAVATNRNVSTDTVLEKMADGRLFIGQQAIDAGLVDGVSTLSELIDKMKSDNHGVAKMVAASDMAAEHVIAGKQGSSAEIVNSTEELKMVTKENVATAHPDIAEALRAEGALAERERIKSVEAQSLPGHEALVSALKFDGKTTGPEAAMKVLQAEKASMGQRLKAIEEDAPTPVAASVVSIHAAKAPQEDRSGLPVEDRCKLDWNENPELRKEFGAFENYVSFERATENGQVKYLKNRRGE